MTLKCGWYRARHQVEGGPFVVRVQAPRRGGSGRSVAAVTWRGPSGALAQLCAAGWGFERFREAARRRQ